MDRPRRVRNQQDLPVRDLKRYEEFARLVRLHTNQVLAYIDSLLMNRSDAEDIFQETCLVLWQKFHEFEPGSNFLAWALRVADYRIMNFQTTQSRRVVFTAELRNALMAEIADRRPEDDDVTLTALSDCTDRLSQEDQRLLKLCYVEDVPVRQLADAMGRPPKGVQKSLYRIRTWLLECIRRETKRAGIFARPHHGISKRQDGP
jgi:RNA polymerase sigma-70 factor, ECF subfamily